MSSEKCKCGTLWYEKYQPVYRKYNDFDDLNFTKTIKNLCNVIKLWYMRKLTLEGKTTIFKSLAISKIVHLAIIKKVSNTVIEELKQIH